MKDPHTDSPDEQRLHAPDSPAEPWIGSCPKCRIAWRTIPPKDRSKPLELKCQGHQCDGIVVMTPIEGFPETDVAEVDSEVTIPLEEYEALKKDKARLDFLEAAHAALNACYGTTYGWEMIINQNVVRYMAGHCYPRDDAYPGIDLHDSKAGHAKVATCREAIDRHLLGNAKVRDRSGGDTPPQNQPPKLP